MFIEHSSNCKEGENLSGFQAKDCTEARMVSSAPPLLQRILDLAPRFFQENCLKIPVEVFSSIATCGVSLFFLGKTLWGFLSIQEILVEFVRDILKFHVTILFLIDWEASVWILFHALATSVPRAVLVAVVLGRVTDSIGGVPGVISIVVHG